MGILTLFLLDNEITKVYKRMAHLEDRVYELEYEMEELRDMIRGFRQTTRDRY